MYLLKEYGQGKREECNRETSQVVSRKATPLLIALSLKVPPPLGVLRKHLLARLSLYSP